MCPPSESSIQGFALFHAVANERWIYLIYEPVARVYHRCIYIPVNLKTHRKIYRLSNLRVHFPVSVWIQFNYSLLENQSDKRILSEEILPQVIIHKEGSGWSSPWLYKQSLLRWCWLWSYPFAGFYPFLTLHCTLRVRYENSMISTC